MNSGCLHCPHCGIATADGMRATDWRNAGKRRAGFQVMTGSNISFLMYGLCLWIFKSGRRI